MEVSAASNSTAQVSQAQIRESAGLAVLKKAIDIEARNTLQLLQAVPQVANNPPNLGNSVDVRA